MAKVTIKTIQFKRGQIAQKPKEAKYGEKIVSCTQITDNNTTIHTIKHSETQEDLCLLKCEWQG